MERDLGAVEDQQQLLCAIVKTGQRAVEGDEPGPAPEDPIEAGAPLGSALAARVALVRLEIGVAPPDQLANQLDGEALRRR